MLSDIKTQKQYLEIPINQRGSWDTCVFYYMSTVAGVQPGANYYSLQFAGTRTNDAEYLMDGISLNKVNGGVMGPPAPPRRLRSISLVAPRAKRIRRRRRTRLA